MASRDTEITITPDPQILQVLSYLEMKPQDSLCELIDNSLDAMAWTVGEPAGIVSIELPTRRQIEEGSAVVRVRDNGPGMTIEQVENALRAGYSAKPRYGSLGLFGVGFNIATGKLGRTTTLVTSREQDDFAVRVTVDLLNLRRAGNFKVVASRILKPESLQHGTVVEVAQPWSANNQNYGFMLKLVGIGRPRIREHLGRVYSTALRNSSIKVFLADEAVKPFEHCVWSDARYVEHAKWGKISAVLRFDGRVIYSCLRCAECGGVVPQKEARCVDPHCESSSLVTQHETVSGWVGIQRYSDASHYGIDLIRNGRAIRILEKSTFFDFEDPVTGAPVHDYPIDQNEGRIVGEVHLNHVPVDPAKQNFERSSPEWRRAIEFVRGASSLQPERPGAEGNRSPIFMLYQGYRKVRGPGRRSMTMGKWEPGRKEAKLLSREEIDVLRRRFEAKEEGYYDDAKWWELVEAADRRPLTGLIKCPICRLESPEGAEECPHCGNVLEGKQCITKDCAKTIKRSAVSCPYCGSNQIPEIRTPWRCEVCAQLNTAEDVSCTSCNCARGTPNPLSREVLSMESDQREDLSISDMTAQLANGEQSAPLAVCVAICKKPLTRHDASGRKTHIPSVRFVENDIHIFIDAEHELFQQGGVALEEQVAYECAGYLFAYYQSLAGNPAHSLTSLAYSILAKHWPERLGTTGIEDRLEALFETVRSRLAQTIGGASSEVYANLSQEEQLAVASEMLRCGHDITELAAFKESGRFAFFLRPKGLLDAFKFDPALFFDGRVWNVTFSIMSGVSRDDCSRLQSQIKREYAGLLEIAAVYSEKGVRDAREVAIALAACNLLSDRLEMPTTACS